MQQSLPTPFKVHICQIQTQNLLFVKHKHTNKQTNKETKNGVGYLTTFHPETCTCVNNRSARKNKLSSASTANKKAISKLNFIVKTNNQRHRTTYKSKYTNK